MTKYLHARKNCFLFKENTDEHSMPPSFFFCWDGVSQVELCPNCATKEHTNLKIFSHRRKITLPGFPQLENYSCRESVIYRLFEDTDREVINLDGFSLSSQTNDAPVLGSPLSMFISYKNYHEARENGADKSLFDLHSFKLDPMFYLYRLTRIRSLTDMFAVPLVKWLLGSELTMEVDAHYNFHYEISGRNMVDENEFHVILGMCRDMITAGMDLRVNIPRVPKDLSFMILLKGYFLPWYWETFSEMNLNTFRREAFSAEAFPLRSAYHVLGAV